MCHFPTFAKHALMDSERANPDCSRLGCPIRRSQDPLVCSSPGLIAAYHVLHRLSAPRHPPYTLSNLTALIPLPESVLPEVNRLALSKCPDVRRFAAAQKSDPENSLNGCYYCTTVSPRCSRFTKLQNTRSSIFKEHYNKFVCVGLVAGAGFEPATSGL